MHFSAFKLGFTREICVEIVEIKGNRGRLDPVVSYFLSHTRFVLHGVEHTNHPNIHRVLGRLFRGTVANRYCELHCPWMAMACNDFPVWALHLLYVLLGRHRVRWIHCYLLLLPYLA